jgi:ribosomal protein S18 acetylase RimI-like enzyme
MMIENSRFTEQEPRPVLRQARPADYNRIIGVVDDWWGRPVSRALPRLFLDHFASTSLIAETGDDLTGFLVGWVSPSQPDVAYIHFAATRPDLRRSGLARSLYERFAAQAVAAGCTELQAITSPANDDSIRFHQRLGFAVSEPISDYNGAGTSMVVFARQLAAAAEDQ